jgi:hypothetical protein
MKVRTHVQAARAVQYVANFLIRIFPGSFEFGFYLLCQHVPEQSI